MNFGIKIFFGDVLALTAYRYNWEHEDDKLIISWSVGHVSGELMLDSNKPTIVNVYYKGKIAVFDRVLFMDCSDDCSKGKLLIFKKKKDVPVRKETVRQ